MTDLVRSGKCCNNFATDRVGDKLSPHSVCQTILRSSFLGGTQPTRVLKANITPNAPGIPSCTHIFPVIQLCSAKAKAMGMITSM